MKNWCSKFVKLKISFCLKCYTKDLNSWYLLNTMVLLIVNMRQSSVQGRISNCSIFISYLMVLPEYDVDEDTYYQENPTDKKDPR